MMALGTRRSVIREIFEYGNRRRAEIGAERVFDFSLGNPSVPAPPIVNETLASLLATRQPAALHGYTSAAGDYGVRRAIADYLQKTHGARAEADLIYLTVGAAAALTISLSAVLPDDGDGEVILFAPFFPEYRVFAERAGGRVRVLPLREPDFSIDPAALREAISERTAAVIINSPNNPCGSVLSEENLREAAAVLQTAEQTYGHPIYLIADEPYRELVYGDVQVPFIPRIYPDTIVCYSFSKSLSLPGERIGYIMVSPEAHGAREVYAAIMGAGRALGFVCAPAIFQHMIPACLGQTADLTVYRANRDLLYNALTEMGYTCVKPDGAFYLFVKAPGGDAIAFCEAAKAYELLLVPSDDFGYPGYIRISYCVATEMIRRALPAFRLAIERYQKRGND
ncbi:MAG: pyridoxal phosphate-dependent aminotransferase, partial [Clostridia bacterium]|nr:pyridoxal phosphate-dependent aminotransferase [Clostridia bacterium]